MGSTKKISSMIPASFHADAEKKTRTTRKLPAIHPQAKEDFERARELEPDPAIDKELKRRLKAKRFGPAGFTHWITG